MRISTSRHHRGTVLIMVALLMVVLLGMVAIAVDISRLYAVRQYLINACDAAALAGGIELPDQTKSAQEAAECADANDLLTYQISFPADGMTADGPSKIRVDGQRNVQYGFANILGFQARTVSAHAIVQRSQSVGWLNGNVVPWGVPYYTASGTPYNYGTGILYTLKTGSQSDLKNGTVGKVGGNFYPLALDRSLGSGGSGANVYNGDIKYGFDGTVKVGDVTDTEPGNMVGPTRQAVISDNDSLFARASVPPWADDTWNNLDYGNARVVIVPIISPLSNGRTTVTILGFAAFYVQSIQGQEVKGYFIDYTVPNAGGSGPVYGVSTFLLVE